MITSSLYANNFPIFNKADLNAGFISTVNALQFQTHTHTHSLYIQYIYIYLIYRHTHHTALKGEHKRGSESKKTQKSAAWKCNYKWESFLKIQTTDTMSLTELNSMNFNSELNT